MPFKRGDKVLFKNQNYCTVTVDQYNDYTVVILEDNKLPYQDIIVNARDLTPVQQTFTFKESCEMSEFMRLSKELAKEIFEDYRHETDRQKMNALEHALWVGFCYGKGWENK